MITRSLYTVYMDKDATWYGSRPRPSPHCVRREPSSATKGAHRPLLFSAHVYCGHGRPSQLLLSSCFFVKRKSTPTSVGCSLSGFVVAEIRTAPGGRLVRFGIGTLIANILVRDVTYLVTS